MSRFLLVLLAILALFSAVMAGWGLPALGRFLVVHDPPVRSDAAVVLNTGVDYYPRLIEAAALYRDGIVERIVVNGNRKTQVLRDLERRGFRSCCPWDENALRILAVLGVPRDGVLTISAEDAYDTISEAEMVGEALVERGLKSVLITTSKFHTRRARHIWRDRFAPRLVIRAAAARSDPFNPDGWWKEGRQIRWVLHEYGAWLFYFWNRYRPGRPNALSAHPKSMLPTPGASSTAQPVQRSNRTTALFAGSIS